MTYTLFTATLDLARTLGDSEDVDATSTGTTTTLVSSNPRITSVTSSSANVYRAENYYNGGTLWFRGVSSSLSTYGNNNYGVYKQIVDYAAGSSSVTFTYTPTSTAAPASGDVATVCPRIWPLDLLKLWINQALSEISLSDQTSTSLTTTADDGQYDLPSGVYNVKKVEIATSTTSPYGYIENSHWYVSNDDLWFEEGWYPTTTGYIIRLTYNPVPDELRAQTDTISDALNRNWLKWAAAELAWEWRLKKTEGKEPDKAAMYQRSVERARRMKAQYQNSLMQRPPAHQHSAFAVPLGDTHLDSDPDHVRI